MSERPTGQSAAAASADAGVAPLSIALRTRADTSKLARVLARSVAPGDLIVLEGDLGAGKTFLVRAFARALGVPKTVPVTSPTFELVHELPGRLPIVHADLYRLSDGESIAELGLLDRIAEGAVALVEWGDRFARELGENGLWLRIDLQTGQARVCQLHARGPSGHALAARLFPRVSELFSPSR